jgi:hypothetical protein
MTKLGPCCPCDQVFTIQTEDGKNEVGAISKKFGGFIQEAFTVADDFGITCNSKYFYVT